MSQISRLLVEELVPPFLAHLPASYSSLQPPPSLFPLLAPIVRQRVSLLLSTLSPPESWVSLLTWSTTDGAELSTHLSTQEFVPHPVSGEIEIGPSVLCGYRRDDSETVKACVKLVDWGLELHYVWVINDPDGEDDGWKIMDLHLIPTNDDAKWTSSVGEAEDVFRSTVMPQGHSRLSSHLAPPISEATYTSENDEDDYWNSYDRTPLRTPPVLQKPPTDEAAYFESYSGVDTAIGDGSSGVRQPSKAITNPYSSRSSDTSVTVPTPPIATNCHLHENTQPYGEMAVKQHISATMKSLYRLSRGIGMEREDFEALVRTELATTILLDEE